MSTCPSMHQVLAADYFANVSCCVCGSEEVELVAPQFLRNAEFMPRMSEPSTLMTPAHVQLLAGSLPGRYRLKDWALLYSTYRHGISLQTLFRRASGHAPSLLVVKDAGGEWGMGVAVQA